MGKDMTYSLRSYEKIIVYGAGTWGSFFLRWLCRQDIDMTRVTVWDMKHELIAERSGFRVSKPDFSRVETDAGVIVVIAFHDRMNAGLILEMKKAFRDAGYNTVITANDVMTEVADVRIEDFEDDGWRGCAYQGDESFADLTPSVKPIAFYLPQFHDIPENDEWWGKGFTEWTNTKKAGPGFRGHYQPRTPHDDFGYYDLSDAGVIKKQAELARRHGIFGWCIYYYWFSGRKLLTKPIDIILENKDIDINFCLFWCPENWTKNWVGDYQTVLLKNEYAKGDPEHFIDDLKKYIDDKRYIRLDGRPLIVVNHLQDIPDIGGVIRCWKKRAREIGIGEIAVIAAIHPLSPADFGVYGSFDGETDFATIFQYFSHALRLTDNGGAPVSTYLRYYGDYVRSYIKAIEADGHEKFLSCCCGFDNTPRYKKLANIYSLGFSLKLFYDLVKYVAGEAAAYKKEHFFVFAWNEWAESAYLEPDKRLGYAMINTFSRALFGLPFECENETKVNIHPTM